jgi:hypothetical protein
MVGRSASVISEKSFGDADVHAGLTSGSQIELSRRSQHRAMILVRFAIGMLAFTLIACAISYSSAESEPRAGSAVYSD